MNQKRTDLALEATEIYRETNGTDSVADGVELDTVSFADAKITRVKITTPNGAELLSKPIGTYVTIETDALAYRSREKYEQLCRTLSNELSRLTEVDLSRPVLVVGLGNRQITADSLGPKCVEQLIVTRHLFEHMPEAVSDDTASVCALSPGVLGITGIETLEIIDGVCRKVKPGLVIAIDALAARNIHRINTTLQISDTGISPGSGVGNHRKSISKDTLGCDVLAIGVPTVVDAYTLASDILDMMANTPQASHASREYIDNALSDAMREMVLTPKEVDLATDKISKLIANGINIFLQKNMTIDEIESFAL